MGVRVSPCPFTKFVFGNQTGEITMTQRLKRWESPRKSGRNDKGKGGSARQRQRKKQLKQLKQTLKRSQQQQRSSEQSPTDSTIEHQPGREAILSFIFGQNGDECLNKTHKSTTSLASLTVHSDNKIIVLRFEPHRHKSYRAAS